MKKQLLTAFIMAMMLVVPMSTQAATKINKLNIKVSVDEEDDNLEPEIKFDIKNKKFSINNYTVINYNYDTEETNGPSFDSESNSDKTTYDKSKPFVCKLELSADDDYYFATLKKEDIKINGLNANCTKASRKDSGKTLILTIELPGLETRLNAVENINLSQDGILTWDKVENADEYEIRVFKDNKSIGQVYKTGGTKFNVNPKLLKTGSYICKVRALSGENKTKYYLSNDIIIDEQTADSNLSEYKIIYEKTGLNGPSADRKPLNTGWQIKDNNYVYRLDDGMFLQNTWLLDRNIWYFFDENGYMIKNTNINWKNKTYSFDNTGKMIPTVKENK